jgi:transposase
MQTTKNPDKSKQTRRKFDQEFKTEALRMVAEGQSACAVARSLNVSQKLIYRWKEQQKNQVGNEKLNRADELDRLKTQLKRVEMEPHRRTGDILKKALIIFGPGGEPQPT